MSEGLKKGWTKVAFGDVVLLVKERSSDPEKDGFERYVGLEHLDPGELKIRRWGDIADGTTFTSVFRAGQILFGKRRSYQRKLALADFDGVCSGDIYVFEPQNDQLLPELLPFICQTDSFFEHAIGTSAGSLSPRTNWMSLAEYEFALPPMEEQKIITELLKKTLIFNNKQKEGIEAIESVLNSYVNHSFSMFSSELGTKQEKLVDLIDEDICNGIFVKRENFGKGIRMINVVDCYKGIEVCIDDLNRVPVSESDYKSYSVYPGDVIFNRSSLVLSGIGKACYVPEVHEKIVFECHLMRVRPNRNRLLGKYLTYYALSPSGRNYLLKRAQTTTMTTVNQNDLREMPVPCPSLHVQKEFLQQIKKIELAKKLMINRQKHLLQNIDKIYANKLIFGGEPS